jgi:hypothetical protein
MPAPKITDLTIKKGSYKLLVLDIIVIGLFVTCLVEALLIYDSTNTQTYSISQIDYNNSGQPAFNVNFNFTTEAVFSALNPITVKIFVFPNPNATKSDPNWLTDTPEYLWMYFPASIPPNPHYDKNGGIYTEPLVLRKGFNATYTNSTTIEYQGETTVCAFILSTFTSSIPPCNSTVYSPILTISPVDSLYQYQSNKNTLSLTFVVLAFTVIFIRVFVADMGRNVNHLWRKE